MGGGSRLSAQMAQFINTIDWCGFWDISFVGPKFTWLYQMHDGT